MASYDDLDDLVGKLKRSAIDAYMRGYPGGWEISEDCYEIRSRAGTATVSRPAADGSGGGDWHHSDFFSRLFVDRDEEFQESFNQIRERIDTAIRPWRGLPDPEEIESDIEDARQITRALAGAAQADSGNVTGGGNIASTLGLMENNLDEMSGQTIATFKLKFLGKLGTAIGGMHAISLVHGFALASEKGIFQQARQAVADAVDNARAVCDKIANSGPGNLEITIMVTKWALKAAQIYATGGVSAAFEVAGLGLEVIEGVNSDKAFKQEAATADSALSAFEGALDAINSEVTASEEKVRGNINTNLGQIRSDKTSYDLTLEAISPQEESTSISQPHVDEITKVYMPSIADDLETTASDTLKVSMPVARSTEVGIGTFGPRDEFAELTWLLYELLQDLSWEVRMGAKTLELAVADIMDTDAQVKAEMEEVANQIKAGSGVDPWN